MFMTTMSVTDKTETAVITADPGVGKAIAEEVAAGNPGGVIRIELTSTGCCDASLGLRLDKAGESDLVEKIEGLTFVLSRKTYDLVGRVRISRRGKGQFVITSEKPVSEWDGFGSCSIKM